MSSVLDDLSRQRDERIAAMDDVATRLQALPDDAPDEERDALNGIFERESSSVERLTDAIRKHEIVAKARQTLQPQDDDEPKDGKTSVRVGKEPLTYERNGKFSFFADLNYARNGDAGAQQRLHRHSSEMRSSCVTWRTRRRRAASSFRRCGCRPSGSSCSVRRGRPRT
jgi:hypothetical protein